MLSEVERNVPPLISSASFSTARIAKRRPLRSHPVPTKRMHFSRGAIPSDRRAASLSIGEGMPRHRTPLWIRVICPAG